MFLPSPIYLDNKFLPPQKLFIICLLENCILCGLCGPICYGKSQNITKERSDGLWGENTFHFDFSLMNLKAIEEDSRPHPVCFLSLSDANLPKFHPYHMLFLVALFHLGKWEDITLQEKRKLSALKLQITFWCDISHHFDETFAYWFCSKVSY